jgi:DNA-3-methyladenine glycosylase II
VKLGRYANYTDEEIIIELTKIKGIGRWTAEMFLIFSLNRPNVLPLDDLGVKKGMMRTYNLKNLPTKTQMERIARKWEPYRTLGSWYMWRSLEV